jgi:Holliday junction resolvase
MNTRAIGRTLEQKIVNKFLEIGVKASLSKNSGCSGYNLGDVNNEYFICEAKQRNTKDISVKDEVWKKLVASLPLHSKRKAIYVIGNKEDTVLCILSLEDMFEIIKGYLENLNGRA